MKIYWDEVVYRFWHWVVPSVGFVGMCIFLVYGLPFLQQVSKENVAKHAVLSDINYFFIDSVVLVKYNYGFWGGLGGITSTTITFANGVNVTLGVEKVVENASGFDPFGPYFLDTAYRTILENQTVQQFTFDGNLAIATGKLYSVQYEVITHADNETKLIPLSIEQTA